MKRAITILLALIMMLSLAACGGGSQTTNAPAPTEAAENTPDPTEAVETTMPTETAETPVSSETKPEIDSDLLGKWINTETGLTSYVFENDGYGYYKVYNLTSLSKGAKAYSEKDFSWKTDGTVINISDNGEEYLFRIDKDNNVIKKNSTAFVPIEQYSEKVTVYLADGEEQTTGRELCRAFQENETSFDSKYKEKPVLIQSKVQSVEQFDMVVMEDKTYSKKTAVCLSGGWCVITYDDNPILSELIIGDSVIATGYLAGCEKYGKGMVLLQQGINGTTIRRNNNALSAEEQAHNAVNAAKQFLYGWDAESAYNVLTAAKSNGYETQELLDYEDHIRAMCFEDTFILRPDKLFSYATLSDEKDQGDGSVEYTFLFSKNYSSLYDILCDYYGEMKVSATTGTMGSITFSIPRSIRYGYYVFS